MEKENLDPEEIIYLVDLARKGETTFPVKRWAAPLFLKYSERYCEVKEVEKYGEIVEEPKTKTRKRKTKKED